MSIIKDCGSRGSKQTTLLVTKPSAEVPCIALLGKQ